MKVKEYLQQLVALTETNPAILEMNVITCSDDEGNSVDLARFGPSVQKWCREEGCFDSDDGEEALCLS